MELRLPKEIDRFFWTIFPLSMTLISIQNIFYGWELQKYRFTELEHYGTLLFVLVSSACESALITVFFWWLLMKFIRYKRE
ncbi:hypothetical protein [Rossellomorea aquimaris]|uniref:hypothetical protein n=1 Tax=Rossellomorea aquimaris TaxID=189382 RepID=UPI0007D066F1|nr:hypothetical protein [Rossellomorea aquimaris]